MDAQPKVYNPTDVYLPLAQRDSKPQDALAVLFKQISIFVDPRTVREAPSHIEEIATIRRHLRTKFLEVLQRHDMMSSPAAQQFEQDQRDTLPAMEDVVRKVHGRELKKILRKELGTQRDSLTADVLERLGLMPHEIFDRTKYICEQKKRGRTEADGRFDFLDETFPEWFLKGNPSRIRSPEKRKAIPKLQARKQWMNRQAAEFQSCIEEAFEELSNFRKSTYPKHKLSQQYEMTSDLRTKSLVELLEIMMHAELPPRRRIDASVLLEEAVGIYVCKRNPVIKAQSSVQKDIHEILNLAAWADDMGREELPIIRRTRSKRKPVFGIARARNGHNPRAVDAADGRLLSEQLGALLAQYSDVLQRTNVVFFQSRSKEPRSIRNKMRRTRERVRECLAVLDGYTVDGTSVGEARAYIRNQKRLLRPIQGKLPLSERPTSMGLIGDNVGVTLSLMLKNSIKYYEKKPRLHKRVKELFERVLDIFIKEFELKDFDVKRNLFERENIYNQGRDRDFRDLKVLGIMKGATPDGDEVDVPVEGRVVPDDTYLLERSPGSKASGDSYGDRKRQRLIAALMPHKVGGIRVNPSVSDTSEVAD